MGNILRPRTRTIAYSVCVILTAVFVLTGCASLSTRGENEVVAGIGKSYESRGDTTADIPVLRVDVLAQCEDRTPESATRDLVSVLNNSLGWVQAVTAISTSPERFGEEVIGEDRAEVIATLSLDNPHSADIPKVISAWADAVDQLNEQSQSCNVFATGNE